MKTASLKKLFKTIFITIIVLVLLRYISYTYPYTPSLPINNNSDQERTIRSLGLFTLPGDYRLMYLNKSKKGSNILTIYLGKEDHESLFLMSLREHKRDSLDHITLLNGITVRSTFPQVSIVWSNVPSFRFTYYLPLFVRRDDLSGMGDEVIIRGMTVDARDKEETPYSEIFYARGMFTKLGFYKERQGLWVYPVPEFDFITLHEGAIAFIQSKTSGNVLICVSVANKGFFQDTDFKTFVRNIRPT